MENITLTMNESSNEGETVQLENIELLTDEIVQLEVDCPICADKYNNSTHKQIICEYGDCNFSACKACIRTYLLNTTTDPHCMQCKKVWTENFIVLHLNRSFIINDYKLHRRQLLLDREISKMPETMHVAERYQRIENQKEISTKLFEKMKEVRKLLCDLQGQWNDSNIKVHQIKNGKDAVVTERKKFIMPCPNNDCRGYLSSQYKCEMCSLHTCSNCHELIGYTKDDPHTCKEENVQSAELIKKETKPCPTCGTRISKISGCDQMWCPECHKAFSWRTGLVDNGIIHNPHFYQYQRENAGNNPVPRAPGDVLCGGLCEWHVLNNNILRKIPTGTLISEQGKELRTCLADIHRFVAHITRVDLTAARTKVRDLSEFEEIRCKYILKQISKDDLAKIIYRNDAQRKKLVEMLHIYELLSVVGTELFTKLLESTVTKDSYIREVLERIEEYNKLREYCNKQFKTISLTYNQTVPCVSKMWVISSKKYTFTPKRVKKDKETAAKEAAEVSIV
jgi:hypothetical protein